MEERERKKTVTSHYPSLGHALELNKNVVE